MEAGLTGPGPNAVPKPQNALPADVLLQEHLDQRSNGRSVYWPHLYRDPANLSLAPRGSTRAGGPLAWSPQPPGYMCTCLRGPVHRSCNVPVNSCLEEFHPSAFVYESIIMLKLVLHTYMQWSVCIQLSTAFITFSSL